MRQIAQQLSVWEEAKVNSESDVTRDSKKIQTGTLCNTDGYMSSQKFGEDELFSVNYATRIQDCLDAQEKRATL